MAPHTAFLYFLLLFIKQLAPILSLLLSWNRILASGPRREVSVQGIVEDVNLRLAAPIGQLIQAKLILGRDTRTEGRIDPFFEPRLAVRHLV